MTRPGGVRLEYADATRVSTMLRALLLGLGLIASTGEAIAQDVLRGHGGPVRALAVNAEKTMPPTI